MRIRISIWSLQLDFWQHKNTLKHHDMHIILYLLFAKQRLKFNACITMRHLICEVVTDRDELDFLFWRKGVITRSLIPLKGSHFKLFFIWRHNHQTPCIVKPSKNGSCISAKTTFIRNWSLNLKAQHNLCINNKWSFLSMLFLLRCV